MSGDVRVEARTDVFLAQFGGSVEITDATARTGPVRQRLDES